MVPMYELFHNFRATSIFICDDKSAASTKFGRWHRNEGDFIPPILKVKEFNIIKPSA